MARSEMRSLQVTQTFMGPIPDPGAMEKYARIDPAFPARLITMAEEQAKHRQALEVKAVESAVRAQDRGLWLAFVIALAGLGSAVLCAYFKQPGPAMVIGGGTVVSLAALFIYGKARNVPRQPPPPPR